MFEICRNKKADSFLFIPVPQTEVVQLKFLEQNKSYTAHIMHVGVCKVILPAYKLLGFKLF